MERGSRDSSTLERVRRVIAETLQVAPERVTPEARFREDLGADSLDTVELIMALEREFEADVLSHIDESWTDTLETYVNRIITVGQVIEWLDLLAPLCCSRPITAESKFHERELEFRTKLWQSPQPENRILALLMTGDLSPGDLGWLG